MRITLSPEENQFVAEVGAFVDAHWPAGMEQHGYAQAVGEGGVPHWLEALAAQGWSVPSWPVAHGGPGWTRREQMLFEQTLASRGAPSPAGIATCYVGPLLMQAGSPEQQATWLPEIRDLGCRWSLAVADADDAARLDGGSLSGSKAWVTGASSARWMLVWAGVWCVVASDARGVSIEPVPMMGDTLDVCRVRFEAVAVGDVQVVDGVGRDWQPPAHAATWTRAIRLKRDFSALPALEETRAEANALGVSIDGLEALELRALDQWLRGEDPSALTLAATIRGIQSGQELSDLKARSMGYYSLPYPDELLLSNEGMIGDELALPAVKQMLFDRAWSLHGEPGAGQSTEVLKNRLARQVLGLPEQQALPEGTDSKFRD